MMHILVTGASGLLGSVLCRRLAERGVKVTAAVRTESYSKISKLHYLSLDLADDDLAKLCPKDIDVIIHLAQSSQFRDFPDSALDVFNVNVASTAHLLDFAKQFGVKQFIYASSGGVYGKGSDDFKENSPIIPPGQLGYYLGSKACGEILVQSYASMFQVIVLRPFFIYGPGQNRSMLIPRLMDFVSSGTAIILQDTDGIRINPLHVEDAAAAVIAALDTKDSSTYNIAGPDVLSIRQISEEMGLFLGKRPVFQSVTGKSMDLIADISAMRSKLCSPTRHLCESFSEL